MVEERRLTDKEFRELNAAVANFDPARFRPRDLKAPSLQPIGDPVPNMLCHGEQVCVQAYIRRPKSARAAAETLGDRFAWKVSLNIDDIKERHGEVFDE